MQFEMRAMRRQWRWCSALVPTRSRRYWPRHGSGALDLAARGPEGRHHRQHLRPRRHSVAGLIARAVGDSARRARRPAADFPARAGAAAAEARVAASLAVAARLVAVA